MATFRLSIRRAWDETKVQYGTIEIEAADEDEAHDLYIEDEAAYNDDEVDWDEPDCVHSDNEEVEIDSITQIEDEQIAA